MSGSPPLRAPRTVASLPGMCLSSIAYRRESREWIERGPSHRIFRLGRTGARTPPAEKTRELLLLAGAGAGVGIRDDDGEGAAAAAGGGVGGLGDDAGRDGESFGAPAVVGPTDDGAKASREVRPATGSGTALTGRQCRGDRRRGSSGAVQRANALDVGDGTKVELAPPTPHPLVALLVAFFTQALSLMLLPGRNPRTVGAVDLDCKRRGASHTVPFAPPTSKTPLPAEGGGEVHLCAVRGGLFGKNRFPLNQASYWRICQSVPRRPMTACPSHTTYRRAILRASREWKNLRFTSSKCHEHPTGGGRGQNHSLGDNR